MSEEAKWWQKALEELFRKKVILLISGLVCILLVGAAEGISVLGKFNYPGVAGPWKWPVFIVGVLLIACGVIGSFRPDEEEDLRRKVKPLGLTIIYPRHGESVEKEFRLVGKFKELPKDLKLGILETAGNQYWCKGEVFLPGKDEWETQEIKPKHKGEDRTFVIVLMKKGGKGEPIYEYLREVSEKFEKGNEEPPGLRSFPPGMVQCGDPRTVFDERRGRSRQA
jgi:hypothetical protein